MIADTARQTLVDEAERFDDFAHVRGVARTIQRLGDRDAVERAIIVWERDAEMRRRTIAELHRAMSASFGRKFVMFDGQAYTWTKCVQEWTLAARILNGHTERLAEARRTLAAGMQPANTNTTPGRRAEGE